MDSHDNPSRRSSHRPSQALTPDQQNARARAAAHRDGLYRRARRIRRSVASLAAVMFSTAFLVIYVQLASGHDPALVANSKRTASASTSTGSSKASTTSTSTDSSTAETVESTPTTSTEESNSGASAVTTSQS
jgi:hypothetical protein